jgi:hypothetical protein
MSEPSNLKPDIDIERFLDEKGRIIQLSQKREIRLAILRYLANRFEDNREYTEKEVNVICEEWHTFEDYFLLRRELIDNHLLRRKVDGSRYWKAKNE